MGRKKMGRNQTKKPAAPKPRSHKRNGLEVKAGAAKPSDFRPVIAKGKLNELLYKARTTRNDTSELSGQLGKAVSEAVEKNHLNRKAFNIIKGLDRMRQDPEKLADVLEAVEHYLDISGLQAVADKVQKLPFGERSGADHDEKEGGDAADGTQGDGAASGTVVQMRQAAE